MTQHSISKALYYRVFALLLGLTFLTMGVAYLNLGRLNTVIALTIAIGKAVLVVLFFMHVRHSHRLVWVCVGAGLFWFVLLLALTMSDYLTRNWLPVSGW